MTHKEAKHHIEQIRRDKFGIFPDGKKRPNSLERDLRAALKHLAEELNAKETHFILELLQNAEDNKYPTGVEPELCISVEAIDPTESGGDGCVCVINNEVGFSPEQVLSLCSLGQSTKDKARGYIGEKGIGFKSVFRVSDHPHVFSNGYRFRFHKPQRHDELGYIVPHWVERAPDLVRPGFTSIFLPLLAGKRTGIAEKLGAIPPETILFLTQLRRLGLGQDHFVARDKTSGVVRLSANAEESVYFVHRQICPRPKDLAEEKRVGITEREVKVALPLKSERPCNGRVFAFLPTELDTGLPFLVNADFLLSASRDSLLDDRRWNQWLLDEIPPTFVKAFLSLLKMPQWKAGAYRFLPIAGDLTPGADFFLPIVESIQTQLKAERSVLTKAGNLVRPEEAHFAGSLATRILRDVPLRRATVKLLHPDLERHLDRLKPLGVRSLTFAQLFEACNEAKWLKNREAEWWETLFELCSKCDISAETVGSFPILRCQDGICHSLSCDVFFRAENQPTPSSLPAEWPTAHVLDTELQSRLQAKPAVWAWLVHVADLRPFSIQSYITSSLLEWMLDQGAEQAASRMLDATRFIASNLKHLDKGAREKLSKNLPWVLAHGRVLLPDQRAGRELVTPEYCEGEVGWNWVFIAQDDRQHFFVLADSYVEGQAPDVRKAVEALMEECGATDLPDPAMRDGPAGTVDWVCPRWLRDLSSAPRRQNQTRKIAALERWIGRFQRDYFAKFLLIGRGAESWRHAAQSGSSELGIALRTLPWLRTTRGFVSPISAFVADAEIRQFLGNAVPYVEAELSTEILGELGVHNRLSSSALLDVLRQIRDSGEVDEALVVRIYRRLQTMEFDSDTFSTEPLVFLSAPRAQWMVTARIVWKDAGDVFDEEFGYAELTYGNEELRGFFTDSLGVREEVSEQRLAEVWAEMSGKDSLPHHVVEKRLNKILPNLAAAIEADNPPEWWLPIRRRLKVWTTAGGFQTPTSVFAPDDTFAEEVFAKAASIAWAPKSHLTARVNRLLRDLGCPSLAENLRSRVSNPAFAPSINRPRLLTSSTVELLVAWVCAAEGWGKKRLQLEQLVPPTKNLWVFSGLFLAKT